MDQDRNFFRNSICHTCKTWQGQTMRRCSKCKIVSYCSKEHQAADWKNHKTLCNVVSNEEKYLEYNVTNYAELQEYKQKRGLLWQLKLGRTLTRAESQMFMFPRVCAICFKREPLFDCSECFSEFYCSIEHQKQSRKIHKQFCVDLKLSLDIECYFHDNNGIFIFTIKEVEEHLLSIPKNVEFVADILENCISTKTVHYFHSCDQIFSGLTLLFALEQAEVLLSRKLPKPTLNIHVVGPGAFEYLLHWALIIEIFFHWIKNLEEINFNFVGPNVVKFATPFPSLKSHFCRPCKDRKNLRIKDEVYNYLYHEKVSDLDKPDVVVAFNSGLHEFYQSEKDPWKDSLSSLVHHPEVPLVLTAYTCDEIENDLQRLKNISKTRVIYGPSKNPFCNQTPLQDWASEKIPVYFINNFLAIIKKCSYF